MGLETHSYAYATLITRSSYLAGIILLAYSLRQHGSNYPLLVFYTPSLPENAIKALQVEGRQTNMILVPVEALLPPSNQPTHLIAARFADTWTKLRVFSEPVFKYDKVCYLDADMMIFNSNMDSVFDDVDLPGGNWLAATQVCCCNKDRDAWAPEEWKSENCAYTGLRHPEALTTSKPVPQKGTGNAMHTHLNGGMFVFTPSADLWAEMLRFFEQCDHLGDMKFPDQDFLAEFFEGRWTSMSWRYNALKTHRYWHRDMWSDDSVICLHYIVDKPWASRIGEDGIAGYRGRDGETHQWWWNEYARWLEERSELGEELIGVVQKHMAKLPGATDEEIDEDMQAIGSNVQAFANNKKPDKIPTPAVNK